MKLSPKTLIRVGAFLLPTLLRRARWRARNPGPADITLGQTPTPEPAALPDEGGLENPMQIRFSMTALLALVAGIAALLVSPEIAPMLPEAWTKVAAMVATALAAFAPKAIERK